MPGKMCRAVLIVSGRRCIAHVCKAQAYHTMHECDCGCRWKVRAWKAESKLAENEGSFLRAANADLGARVRELEAEAESYKSQLAWRKNPTRPRIAAREARERKVD